ncbi:MAG: hypothetical protein JW850_16745 [Thermoflexales bacterium]|nr:hypothetical protein [Thermoflexales bacterium]
MRNFFESVVSNHLLSNAWNEIGLRRVKWCAWLFVRVIRRALAPSFPGVRRDRLVFTLDPAGCTAAIERETGQRAWLIRLYSFVYHQLDDSDSTSRGGLIRRRWGHELPDDPLSEVGRAAMATINARSMVYCVAVSAVAMVLIAKALGNPALVVLEAAIAEFTLAACLVNMVYYDMVGG